MERPDRARYLKRAVLIIASLVVILALLVMAYFVFLSNSSSTGVVSAPKPETNRLERKNTKLDLRGKYFQIKYPSAYATQNTNFNTNTASIVEQYNFIANTIYDKRMAIVIQRNPEKLIENPSYKMRTLYPDKYHQRQLTVDGNQATVFGNIETGEQGLFMQKGELQASIVLVAQGQEQLEKEMNEIAASFRWVN
jgi:hypothetical protein